MNNISIFYKGQYTLGEGLLITQDALLWLDIVESMLIIQELKGQHYSYRLPEQASAIWKVEDNVVLLASESGLCSFNLEFEKWKVIAPIPVTSMEMRANDGGEFIKSWYLFGTMHKQSANLGGSLYLTNGKMTKEVFRYIGIPNTFVKINASQILVSDSYEKIIYKFNVCIKTQKVIKAGVWLDLKRESFTPDGGCIDSQGYIYIAMWDGYCIKKYDIEANLIKSYEMPVPRPTNCVLSQDEKSLYITSAREGLSNSQLSTYPESGSILQLNLI